MYKPQFNLEAGATSSFVLNELEFVFLLMLEYIQAPIFSNL